jgi:fatty-acyl-CoA synthase
MNSSLLLFSQNWIERRLATATETELLNYARDHLAHFKCPQRIQFVSELPKTAMVKVQKYVLRKPAISKQWQA